MSPLKMGKWGENGGGLKIGRLGVLAGLTVNQFLLWFFFNRFLLWFFFVSEYGAESSALPPEVEEVKHRH